MAKQKKSMKKKTKIVITVAVVLVVAASIAPAVVFGRELFCKGNQEQYSAASTPTLDGSPLAGKQSFFSAAL